MLLQRSASRQRFYLQALLIPCFHYKYKRAHRCGLWYCFCAVYGVRLARYVSTMFFRSSLGTGTGWTRRQGLDSRQVLHSIQICSGAHTSFYPMGIVCRGMKLTTHLHLVSRSRIVELAYLHSPLSSRDSIIQIAVIPRVNKSEK
jgi:hypothetical protein